MKTAGIIGGSGYIGSYVTKRFLEENYSVKVTARDISKKKKYEHLKQLQSAENLAVVQADVTDIDSLRAFMDGCDIVVHTGTPFQLDVKDPIKELFEPTIKGTENFLALIQESGTVKQVVVVASVAAFNTGYPLPVEGLPADHLYTESDEPHLNEEGHPYCQAKYYADQVVRKFVVDHPQSDIDIVSVYPTGVMGPALSQRDDSTSMGLQYLFKNKIAPNPFMQMLYDSDMEFAIVDVRDVAEGIFRAATKGGLHGRQYYLSNESWKVSDISRMLNSAPVQEKCRFVYSGKRAEQELGITYKTAAASFNDYAAGI
ncbi:SDR family NAD(P)-dependent oxidoreductase [Rhodohalobacter sp. SW132]|uniref:NAD-dependent epimerase/dehydratase family protein n=1 Tax=Rhodohalobacter sp. SW132 TaxID=2293433 RepID=UPI000E260C6C|nr:NAD-dependent epimerase/dehydratase family protein [Rhodohalobacter sp. SW132]REL38761.1 SDR family NAD(P)-dependent oxidoreductase [Rhodohalobacter sp. SW132]